MVALGDSDPRHFDSSEFFRCVVRLFLLHRFECLVKSVEPIGGGRDASIIFRQPCCRFRKDVQSESARTNIVGTLELRTLDTRRFLFRLPQSLSRWPHRAFLGFMNGTAKLFDRIAQDQRTGFSLSARRSIELGCCFLGARAKIFMITEKNTGVRKIPKKVTPIIPANTAVPNA
jgi:hypothetical protein